MYKWLKQFYQYSTAPVSIAPLAVFRVLFGGVMLASVIRFLIKGWVAELYINPDFHFSYYGFGWLEPFSATGMYLVFAFMALSALGIMLGLFYRLAAPLFFLTFTYVELLDKTTYLNHYYFVSIVAFIMILVPAHRRFSFDVWRKPALQVGQVPRWCVGIFRLQLGLVYFYAGVAKLNSEWLFNAMPLKIWLPANSDMPLIGWLFDYTWMAFAFSWFGALYDLTIPFFLLNRKTRLPAYGAVIVFHMMTLFLFQIGMFPYIMILATLIFFPARFHEKIIQKITKRSKPQQATPAYQPAWQYLLAGILALHFLLQVLIPWRFLLYPGKLFWHEQGYRFSWRVMLMEKAGTAFFYVKDAASNKESEVDPGTYLTRLQEKMMASQPDMILEFAHYLEEVFRQKGYQDPQVRAECYVTLNGRRSRLLIDPHKDLTEAERGWDHKDWILPLDSSKHISRTH